MGVLLDVILGTETSTPPWRQALLDYAATTATVEADGTGTGAAGSDTAIERLDALAEVRAVYELREAFGDLAEARDVLLRLAGILDRLDAAPGDAAVANKPARADTKTNSKRRPST